MSTEQKKQYIPGVAAILAVAVFIFAAFSLLGQTNIMDISMDPGVGGGWSYELVSEDGIRPAKPVLVDEYTVSFPGEKARAVMAARTITEEMRAAQLGIYLYYAVCGVDILLDGEIFYTSFEGAERDSAGLVDTSGFGPSPTETVEVQLPEDYIGRELTVITYFPSETTEIVPVFPYLCNVDTRFSSAAVENVPTIALATICAILAFLTALVYLLDIFNGKADKKVLLLTLFYIMLFLDQGFSSLAGTYSLLTEKLNVLDFAGELYMAPLLMFAALSLTSWRRWILAAATGTWFVFDVVKLIRSRLEYGPFYGQASSPVIFALYLLTLAMAVAEAVAKGRKRPRKSDMVYIGIAAAASVLRIIMESARWDWNVDTYVRQLIISPLSEGYFYPLVELISYVCAATATCAVIIEFVKRTARTRETINALEEHSRQAMESYRRMEEAGKATASARHEMRHHLLALNGMLKNGDSAGALEYISSVSSELDRLPAARYSRNMMVNVIAGDYLDRAVREGVKVRYGFELPEKLSIPDNELCVLVTNILENAVEACERMKPEEERYINVKLSLDGTVLFMGCENSRPSSETDARESWGMKNITRVVEKYGGAIKIDQRPAAFSVTAYLMIGE